MALSKIHHVTSPEDRTRFVRLGLVIIEELTPVLQDVLTTEIVPSQILNAVQRKKSLLNIIRQDQMDKIHNAHTRGYQDFDINLLYTLLRNLCPTIQKPTNGWGISEMPDQGETTLGDDIERIRLIRNTVIGHSPVASLSETQFKEYWSTIYDICYRMQTRLGNNYVQSLQNAEERTIDSSTEKIYMNKLKELIKDDKSTRELIQNMERLIEGLFSQETVRIETRNPKKRKLAETLTENSVNILNIMVDGIHEHTSESDLEQLYESIEDFIREENKESSSLASDPFFSGLTQKIEAYANLHENKMKILARFLRFNLKLKRNYSAFLESSKGSLLLKLTFTSKEGYDLYRQDLERGVIGKQIQEVLLFPPYLANFDLEPEDLVVYLNDERLTQGNVSRILECEKKTIMDPRYYAQDTILCDLCQRDALQNHCEFCHVNLCIVCVGKHLSDSSKRHKVVPYKHRKSTPNVNYPKCQNHTQKHCELYCEKCDVPVCSTCISSGKHKGHTITDILQKTKDLKNDLQELEQRIYPTYEEISLDLNSEKLDFEKHYGKLTTAVTKQGEDWHRKIDVIVNKKKSEIDEMKTKHLAILDKQENEIKQIISDVNQSILDLKKILDSIDITLTVAYKSRNSEFRSLPPKINVSLPSFSPHQITTAQLHQMFGSLSALSITTEEHGYTMKTPEALSCFPVKPLLDEPKLITTIDTGYKYLHSVTCLIDEEIWTCGLDNIMKLYNLQDELLKSIQTKSRRIPRDIAVTRSGGLVYTDPDTRTVNIMKSDQIQELIRLQGWRPLYVCSTSSDDLLVTMLSEDGKQSKVVRYSGSKEKQTIQFDSEGKPLFSSGYYKYIHENRNRDICVADCVAGTLVVVNKAGNLRFRYTGHPPTIERSFCPLGITTDSQSQILTADCINHFIHIIDQDGQCLRYIDNCGLQHPWGICVDTRDNLFVADCNGGKLKKIRYM